jgi:outer membrane lipoprotein-sorting protein
MQTATTRSLKPVCLLLGLSAIPAFAVGPDKAKDYLTRSIRGDFKVNVSGVIRQRDPNTGLFAVIKVQRSAGGRIRNTTVAPLREQGTESIDDGKRQLTYLPAEKLLLDQPSMAKSGDANFRLPLITQNYVLESEPGRQIAGRSTIKVTASSKHKAVGGIRLYFDVETGYPLRKESFDPNGSRLLYEISEISFPKEMSKETFMMKVSGVVYERVNFSEPTKIRDEKQVEKQLGFLPVLSPQLPLGFKIQSKTITEKSSWKAVSMKITDGLQKITIYQWRSNPKEQMISGEERTTSIVSKSENIRVMIVSDISSEIRSQILAAFEKAYTDRGRTVRRLDREQALRYH